MPTDALYRAVRAVAIEDMMSDDTRQLLNAHNAAILRELDRIHTSVAANLGDLKEDMGAIRERMDIHNNEDARRFGELENGVGVLKWAYGAGIFILGAILALLRMGAL